MKSFLLGCLIVLALPAQAEFSRTYIDALPLLRAPANGIEIAYRTAGGEERPAVFMIMGLGASHIAWGDSMVRGVEAGGFRVILLDNRDTGGSTRFDSWGQPTLWWQFIKNRLGFEVDAPYTLNDMASDTVGLMDRLGIDDAHVVGASMGGMIAQLVAANHPQRTRSLVSIMSSTGAPHLPPPSEEASNSLQNVAAGGGGDAERAASIQERGFYPESMPRQMMAIFKTGDRSQAVASITRPTLVLHGAEDALLPPEHGRHTAELVPDANLVIFEGMGHNLPDEVIPELLATMNRHMQAADNGLPR
jgi:pimeloyl-ACP methyl ester carboxylesterase